MFLEREKTEWINFWLLEFAIREQSNTSGIQH